MTSIKFFQVKEKLANVVVNGKESKFYVEKLGNGWYEIQWGRLYNRYSFRKAFYSNQDKKEIKSILQEIVNKPVKIETHRDGVYKYATQD